MRRRRTKLSVNRALTKPIQTLKALVLCFGGPSACEASVELECCVVFILRFGPILTGVLALVLGGCSTARFGGLDEPRYSGGPRQLQSERRVEAPARSVAPVYKVERTVEPRARYSAGSRDGRDGSGFPSDTPRRTYGQQDDTSRYTPQNKGSRLSARQTQRPAQRVPVYRRHVTGRWMGRSWVGRSTATQEPFDPDRLTAAHATLPLPSYVYVTNRGNGRTVLVRVNDRPSSVVGRDREKMFLVSRRVADLLDFSRKGSADLELQFAGPAGFVSSGQHEESFLRRQRWYGQAAGDASVAQQVAGSYRGRPSSGADIRPRSSGVAGGALPYGGGTSTYPRWEGSGRTR